MIRFRTLTTIAALSLSLTSLSGCGDNETKNNAAPRNVSTNDELRANRDRLINDGRDRLTDRTNRSSMNEAIRARNARGYITPEAVAYEPGNYTTQQTATPSGYVRLCPCPTQQQTPNTTTPRPTAPAPTAPAPTAPKPTTPTPSTTVGGELTATETRVIELTNAERRNAGLPALQADTALSKVAQAKSNDMRAKNYFSHTSPTYGSPFDMMRSFGVSYSYAGENIAKGQRSADEVVRAWMNSAGHRANIMSRNFTHIGVGHETTQNIWTQMFISK